MLAEFHPWSMGHLIALSLIAGLGAGFFILTPRLSDTARQGVRRLLAAVMVVYALITYADVFRSGHAALAWALPLQLCDLLMVATVAALLRPAVMVLEIVYYLGLAASVQALLTPDLSTGWPSWAYVSFFWGHGMIVLTVACLLAQGTRPRARGALSVFGFLNLYVLIVGMLDVAFGWNYGYLRHPPAHASLLDHFGPWPWYILGMEAVACCSLLLLALPWWWLDRAMQGRGQDGK